MALLFGAPLIRPISKNYKLYRTKLSGQSVILAGIFTLHPCIMNIKSSKSMTYTKLNLPNLCTNTSTKNFPIIFKTTSIKFLEIMATPLELQQMMTSLFHFSGLIGAKNHSSIKDQNYGILFPKI